MSYLQTQRQTHLAFKTWFRRGQRFSTRFFRRYTVKNADIERAGEEKEKNKKLFEKERVVTECDFQQDALDRRILFEMLGERLHPDDYPDETSESDHGELTDPVASAK